ncbi:sorbosone dehydrogenase family protein [Parageobacillus thermoglucosidasius]|uniref:PQQ-dependent sugar dehydrogenase n=1 Tax=Parageobacillus thermoglucosidasius TaxID=1426 RepID=UPI002E1A7F5E|nr:sorbosone dehydrogenase family protein [Parageobacillus thermoglucosidasius]MED4912727.1 sorbosone dehydrogenase family protein [Parageobacillus thermoglucosidasius]MED4945117.1 sorbosone dehydrogenase family protein [Parageobacillus thermoglucosidasius]MED4982226.1 sorbosone dehydrogenase family protein [Parageobacillus thermoglucosidasius]
MKKYPLITIGIIFLLIGCSMEKREESSPQNEQQINDNGNMEIIAQDLRVPWAIDWDGTAFYISERTGSIVKIAGDEKIRQPLHLEKQLSTASEAGVLGFVLHPEKKNHAFLYYTYEDKNGQFNRVVEIREENNEWFEQKVLLDQIPSGNFHHGGRIKIGPDKKLYITTGDATDAMIAQDKASLGGKILRMNLDGTIPDDNPYPSSFVYSYGHRNPQGLAWDETGQLYSSEHGSSAHDEINLIKPKGNYGWPLIQGDETKNGMIAPLFHSGDHTWAPSGIAYHNGILYVAQLRGEGVLAFNVKEKTYKQIVSNVGRVRDVFILRNYLFFVTNNTDGRGAPANHDDKLIKMAIPKAF